MDILARREKDVIAVQHGKWMAERVGKSLFGKDRVRPTQNPPPPKANRGYLRRFHSNASTATEGSSQGHAQRELLGTAPAGRT